ncbi:MAG TPA: hypothetical protein VMA53_03480 [Stellaceae bacterium]|nr:hypothetical protein [Stellaceae bacterium]
MRILARTQNRYSPLVAVLLGLAIASTIGAHALRHAAVSAVHASRDLVYQFRLEVEPAVVTGGLVVSRNRHTIAGGTMGCAAGAGLGASAAAVFGVVSGGLALPAVPPAAALGCAAGGAVGIAVGYPLDNWAFN